MGRAKVKLEPIEKERCRNSTFQKRKKGLKKKMYEFTTLCDVEACLIIFGSKQGNHLVEPAESWPEDRGDVLRIIDRFRKHSREEQGRRETGLPHFFEDQTKKLRCELSKLRNRNDKAKYPTWDEQFENFNESQLRNFADSLTSILELVDQKIEKETKDTIQSIFKQATGLIGYPLPSLNQYLPSLPPPPPPPYWASSSKTTIDDLNMPLHMNPIQPLSCLEPNLDHLHHYLPASDSPTMNSGMDFMGNNYYSGSSSSIVPYLPDAPMSSPPIYYDHPILPTSDEIALHDNNGVGGLSSNYYYSPEMKPMGHHSFFASQQHQITEFTDLQDYNFMKQ